MDVKELKRYWRVWRTSVGVNFSVIAISRVDFFAFFAGKMIRMFFFVFFFMALYGKTGLIAGYSRGEALLIFACMNLVDVITQMLWFRGLTDLQRLIKTGEFDVVLTKPISPLFWSAVRIFDLIDVATFPVAIGIFWYALTQLPALPSLHGVLLAIPLFFAALLIAFSINLIVASLNFWTTEINHAWWLYRDLVFMSRYPPTIFPEIVRLGLIYGVPILVIVDYPAHTLFGRIDGWGIAWILLAAVLWFALAQFVWKTALRHYTSASS